MTGKKYFYYSSLCLNESREPEKELKKLNIQVASSVALIIPIILLSLPHILPAQFFVMFVQVLFIGV